MANFGSHKSYCKKVRSVLKEAGYSLKGKKIVGTPKGGYERVKKIAHAQFAGLLNISMPEKGDYLCDVCDSILC